MSTSSQALQQAMAKPSRNMAMPQPKQKLTSKKTPTKAKAQMHRRSRTGCYTCRLRRKKCDEGNPSCSACKNLGLSCEYKRPIWWSDNDYRHQHKDHIKVIIKRKKLSEKGPKSSQLMTPACDSPPELSHSLPTSSCYSIDRTRSASVDSNLSTLDFDMDANPVIADFSVYNPQLHLSHPHYEPTYPTYSSPYDIDVKTESHMFVNDSLARRESTHSTYSNFAPPIEVLHPSDPEENRWTEDICVERPESLNGAVSAEHLTYSHGLPIDAPRRYALDLLEGDQRMLDHFVDFVMPSLFPILERNHQGSQESLVLSALQSNPSYVHCCLSIAAQHFKSTLEGPTEQIDTEIMRHRYSTIYALCDALEEDRNHAAILEATLAMINFQCSVGLASDTLPDVPWHQHFSAAVSLVQKLDLPALVLEPKSSSEGTPFNLTLSAHIDILGATMLGRAPTFAHTYREKHLSTSGSSLGLRELMGCEDRVLYLISEIACLEALKRDGMDDVQLCNHVTSLGGQIGLTEVGDNGPKIPFNGRGVLNPMQLSKNITHAFRLAARIYLCSLVPGFQISSDSCMGLVARLAQSLEFIPGGLGGFDKCMTWVYLIGGAASMQGSGFRRLFDERVGALEGSSEVGSFGKLNLVLGEVWRNVDGDVEAPYVSWRDVMQMKGWDFLLI